MVGYDMSVSLAGGYVVAEVLGMEDFEHGWRNDVVVEMAAFFLARGVLWWSSFLATSNARTRNFAP